MSGLRTTVELVYLLAAVCFVLGLHLMNSPATARRGNLLSAAGMTAAIVATFVLLVDDGLITATGVGGLAAGLLLGGVAGLVTATAHNVAGYVLGFAAVAFGAANVVGGYVVTDRMLHMFRARPARPADTTSERGRPS